MRRSKQYTVPPSMTWRAVESRATGEREAFRKADGVFWLVMIAVLMGAGLAFYLI
jgi:hypothetical protein